MKSRILLAATFLILGLSAQACVFTSGPTHGVLFSNTKFPGEFNPSPDIKAQKTAQGCQHTILSLVSIGNAGAGITAKENGISRIATIDYKATYVLSFLYSRFCSVVTGE